MPHGRSDEDWERMMEAGRDIMVRTARAEGLIAYREFNTALADEADVSPFDLSRDGERNALGTLLADIVKDDPLRNQFMLSAVVKLADRDKGPGDGFYKLAEHLGFIEPGASRTTKEMAWAVHVGRAHEHHKNSRRRR